jgi:hypothetical protein
MEGLETLRDFVLFGVNPTMLESAVYRFSAVLKFSLNPLDIAEPWTVGEGCEHAGRDEVGNFAEILFFFCQPGNLQLIHKTQGDKVLWLIFISELSL